MKKNSTILLILIFIFGLSLLLYPTLSNYWNSFHSSKAIGSYAEEVATLDEEQYQHLWDDAHAYNEELRVRANQYVLDEEQALRYNEFLNLNGSGIMGYIEIESLGVSLPIYHGTEDAVLQIAVGHLDWTSLPTGGEGTHSVLSGHRGLPSAKTIPFWCITFVITNSFVPPITPPPPTPTPPTPPPRLPQTGQLW